MNVNRLLYLKEKDFVSISVTEKEVKNIYSIRSEINRIAKTYFFSIREYRKLVKKELNLANKIPIYFSSTLLLFYINSKSTLFWINYFMILKICYEKNIFIFLQNGEVIELEVSKRAFVRELKKVNIVLNYVNNLWNDSVFIADLLDYFNWNNIFKVI